jgi:methionyl-tRNA formyltransferase
MEPSTGTSAPSRPRLVLFSEDNSPFGERFLQEILRHEGSEPVAVVTRKHGTLCPDYPARDISVVTAAREAGLPVLRFRRTEALVAALESLGADHFLVANFQQRLPARIARVPRGFCINFHVGPLPRYAGLIPWHWMWVNRETNGGVAAIRVSERIDAGDIVDEIAVPLPVGTSEAEIRRLHFEAAYLLLQRVLDRLPTLSSPDFRPQDLKLRTYFNRTGPVLRECGSDAMAKPVS